MWRKISFVCLYTRYFWNITKRNVIGLAIPKWVWLTPINLRKENNPTKETILKIKLKMKEKMQVTLKHLFLSLQLSLIFRVKLLYTTIKLLSLRRMIKMTRIHGKISTKRFLENFFKEGKTFTDEFLHICNTKPNEPQNILK